MQATEPEAQKRSIADPAHLDALIGDRLGIQVNVPWGPGELELDGLRDPALEEYVFSDVGGDGDGGGAPGDGGDGGDGGAGDGGDGGPGDGGDGAGGDE